MLWLQSALDVQGTMLLFNFVTNSRQLHTTHNSQLGEGAFKDLKACVNAPDNLAIVPIDVRDEVRINICVCKPHTDLFVGFPLCHFRKFEQRSKLWDLLNWPPKQIQLNSLSRLKITSATIK